MGRLEVEPGELLAGRSRQGALASEVRGVRGHLDGTAGNAGAAGEAGATAAVEEFGRGWAETLAALDQALDRMAGNLGAAAEAYQTTDSSSMPDVGGG